MTLNDLLSGKYYLTYPDGSYVGLDKSSGGYPYSTLQFYNIKFWNDLKEVNNYRRMFPRENFTLNQVVSVTTRELPS